MHRLTLFALLFTLASAACGSAEESMPQEVWTGFVGAVNEGDVEAVEVFLDPKIEWTWDSNLLGIHRSASGRDEAVTGIKDLMERGVTFDSTVIEVVGTMLTAETVFSEPGLSDLLGGLTLLQTDVVTVSDGVIVTWECTADATVPAEE